MDMIHRLRVVGYKSFRSFAVDLEPLTILIESNTAIQNSIIDAVGLLSRLVTTHSVSDAFKELGIEPLDVFFHSEENIEKQDELMFRIEVDVELTEDLRQQVDTILSFHGSKRGTKSCRLDKFLRYEVGIAMDLDTGSLKVKHEYLCSLVKDPSTGKLVPDDEKLPFIDSFEGKLLLCHEREFRVTKYELGLPYTLISQPWYPPHYPHLFALRIALSNWGVYYLDPNRMREESPLKEVTRISLCGGDLAGFYYTLLQRNPLQFQNISRVLRMLVPSVEAMDVVLTSDGRLRLRVKERGVWFSSRVISEGVIRLLGLLAVLISHPKGSVIAIKEVARGLHPNALYIVTKILQEISQSRQLIISTNSTWLARDNILVVQTQ